MNEEESQRTEAYDDVAELEDIQYEMKQLLQRAMRIARKYNKEATSKGYWYAQIAMAVDNDHGYLGDGGYTLQDLIEYIQ